jgi:hypothetical protein
MHPNHPRLGGVDFEDEDVVRRHRERELSAAGLVS